MRDFERPRPKSVSRAGAPEHGRALPPPGPDRLLGNGSLSALGPGVPLPAGLRLSMARMFDGEDFGDVRIHTGPSAAESARALPALAYTVGRDVVFGPGQYRPDTDAGLRLLTHELTHTVQQRRTGTARVQAQRPPGWWRTDPEELDANRTADRIPGRNQPPRRAPWEDISTTDVDRLLDCVKELGPLHREQCYDIVLGITLSGASLGRLPLATRLELKSHEVPVHVDWVAAFARYFKPKPDQPPPLPPKTRVDVGISVDPLLTENVRAVGAYVMDQAARGRDLLPPNRTTNINVPAAGQVFRFTRVGDAVLLIEQVGSSTAFPAVLPDALVTDRTMVVGGRTYQLDSNWRANDHAKLAAVLALFPANALPPVPLIFKRAPDPNCPPGTPLTKCNPKWEAMHVYNFNARQHEITVFDAAFTTDPRREGTWPKLYAVLAHEVGHAHDQETLAKPYKRFRTVPDGTLAERIARLLRVRSPSGFSFTVDNPSRNVVNTGLLLDPTSREGEFRRAALADGLKMDAVGTLAHGVTDYSENGWDDVYAEAFSIYIDDPELLRDLRPNLYAYFVGKFPR
jgi:Domain of unknown function (DUF4157)